jgi:hypothetical protein
MQLTIELVPGTAKQHSLYCYLTARVWNAIRQNVLSAYEFRCNSCGIIGGQLNCHEQWKYNGATSVQRLEKIVSLCQLCHLVTHMNTQAASFEVLASHFMRVNDCSREEFETYYQCCKEEQDQLADGDPDHVIRIWVQDWGNYAATLMQQGNLKRRYEWKDGDILSHCSPRRRKSSLNN